MRIKLSAGCGESTFRSKIFVNIHFRIVPSGATTGLLKQESLFFFRQGAALKEQADTVKNIRLHEEIALLSFRISDLKRLLPRFFQSCCISGVNVVVMAKLL